MIVGLGIDAVGIERIRRLLERHGERLVARCFATGEVRRPRDAQHVAGLLAAKEAAFKALGTVWSGGVSWRQVVRYIRIIVATSFQRLLRRITDNPLSIFDRNFFQQGHRPGFPNSCQRHDHRPA